MIYLIKVKYEGVVLLKVGYAKNIKKRLDQYTTENPLFELLDYREGDKKLESLLHELFYEYKFEKGREWFYYNDFIVENFNFNFEESYLIEKIKRKIDRAKSFSRKMKLYCEFKEKYPEINFTINHFQKYLSVLGIDKCKEFRYKENLLYKEIYNSDNFEKLKKEDENIIESFLNNHFYKTGIFREKMKMYCEFRENFQDNQFIIESLEHRITDQRFHQYYKYYGASGCKARKYEELELKHGWEDSTKEDRLKSTIYSYFKEGDRVAMSTLKEKLREMYSNLQMSKSPKATDILEYFDVSKTNITIDGIVKKGFKLGRRLQ